MYETGFPGVSAVGDVRSGSVKRVASAVGEGAIAVRQVHDFLGAADDADKRYSPHPCALTRSCRYVYAAARTDSSLSRPAPSAPPSVASELVSHASFM